MTWSECYSKADMPDMPKIAAFVASPLWEALCTHLENSYGVSPKIDYSTCAFAPGWNVKYRKSGRALCTLYPDHGTFTCLVTVGNRETVAAELLLPGFSEAVRHLYLTTKPFNGGRWLMIPVTSSQILEDTKQLIALRMQKQEKSADA